MKGTLAGRHYSFMKAFTLAMLLVGTATGQIAVPFNARPTELVRFREAAAPLESWLGGRIS